jgi:hypothetical protein
MSKWCIAQVPAACRAGSSRLLRLSVEVVAIAEPDLRRLDKINCRSLGSTCVRYLQRPVSPTFLEPDTSGTKVVPAGLVLNGRVSKWRLRCASPQMF